MGTRRTGNKGTAHQGDSGQVPGTPPILSPLQLHYLRLLEHSIEVKNSYQAEPGQEKWLLKAINSAAYSAFSSCCEHGAEREAKALLHRGQESN